MALTLLDQTANGNNLTNVNTATDVTSNLPMVTSLHGALLTAASSQYFTAASSASLNIATTMTLQLWVKFTNLPGSGTSMTLISKGTYSTDEQFIFYISNTGAQYRLICEISGAADNSVRDRYYVVITPSSGVWYHYAVAINAANASATTFEFMLNGASLGNGTAILSDNSASIHASSSVAYIGADNNFNGGGIEQFLDGTVDDVRVYNVTRTATQVNSDYTVQLTTPLSASLIAYWPYEVVSAPGSLGGAAFFFNLV